MTKIHVESLSEGAFENLKRVTLCVRYGDKESRIELAVPDPLYEQEPEVEAYRRELQGLQAALEEWEASQEAIAGLAPEKT
jgi:hypothetical protein